MPDRNRLQHFKKIVLIATFTLFTIISFGQANNPPPPPAGSGNNNSNDMTSNGGGAPSGDGAIILVAFVLIYAGKRFYDYRKAQKEEVA